MIYDLFFMNFVCFLVFTIPIMRLSQTDMTQFLKSLLTGDNDRSQATWMIASYFG